MKTSIVIVVATGLLSYWFAHTFPTFALWLFVGGAGTTFTAMWVVIKKPYTKAAFGAGTYLQSLMNSTPWKLNFYANLAMVVGYACAGVWLLALVAAVYLGVLSWFRKKAIAEWEKDNSIGA